MATRTFIEETLSAGRGVLALILGDRQAARYFDLGQRGLVSSLIAFLGVDVILAYGPALIGQTAGGTGSGLLVSLALAAIPIALAALMLRMVGRMDGFVPFLVADLWANAFLSLLMAAMLLFGLPFVMVVMGLAIVVIVVEVNIARLIVTLPPVQVAMFVIAQFAGGLIGMMLLGMLLGAPADIGAVPA